jgi:serine protease Do
MASALSMHDANGVLIGDVTPNGPAAEAGIKPGDVIVKMKGQPVTDSAALRLQVSETDPGTTVPITVRRGTSTRDFTIKLGELPADHQKTAEGGSEQGTLQGLQVEPLTPAIRQQLHLGAASHGAVISQIDPTSAAASAGLREGDVVEEINHQPIDGVSEFENAMRSAGNQAILLRVVRDGTGFYVAIAGH